MLSLLLVSSFWLWAAMTEVPRWQRKKLSLAQSHRIPLMLFFEQASQHGVSAPELPPTLEAPEQILVPAFGRRPWHAFPVRLLGRFLHRTGSDVQGQTRADGDAVPAGDVLLDLFLADT